MDDTQVKKRIFHRFCKWYHQGVISNAEGLDAPELVVLLKAVGFSLNSLSFDSGHTAGGCRVVVECGVSGVRAELTAPPGDKCRCNRFSKKQVEPQQLKEQASLWQVTTSQESLNVSSIGSSILPDLEPARLGVMREVLLLLQEEMVLAKPADRSRRLSSGSVSSVHHSFESLQVRMDEISKDAAATAAKFERRASISCCDDLKSADLPPTGPFLTPDTSHLTWGATSSSSLPNTWCSDASNSTFVVNEGNTVLKSHLTSIIKSATEALKALESQKVTSKPPLVRKTTFSLNDSKEGIDEASHKKARVMQTPGPLRRSHSMSRGRTTVKPTVPSLPKIPVATSTVPTAPKTDPTRRRTFGTVRETRPITRVTSEIPSFVLDKATNSSTPHEPNVFKRLSVIKKTKPQPPTPDAFKKY